MDYAMGDSIDSQYAEEEEELAVLEFARSIGIARDHQLDDTSVDELLSMKDKLEPHFFLDLDHEHLPQFNVQAHINLDERLFVCKGAAQLLSSMAQNESRESIGESIGGLMDPFGNRGVKQMKVELPLLASDPESDFRGFARRDGFELLPQDIKLPLELLSVENNEGLEFPPEFYTFETEAFETITGEKIEVTRNSMVYLQMALKAKLTRDDEQDNWESVRTHSRKFSISNHVTPPLSPICAPEPDSPLTFLPSACEISLLSDPESLTSLDLKKIEDEVFKEDLPTPIRDRYTTRTMYSESGHQFVKPADICSPPECVNNFHPSSSSPLEKKRVLLADLKVEELLTPPRPPLEESQPRSVHFSHIVEELLLNSRPQSGFSEPVLETKFFEEAFGESEEQANHRVEQERLVDTRNRVEVPAMDFSIPMPRWMVTNFHSVNAVSSILQKNIEDVGIDRSEQWPGLKRLHAKLPWAPFKHDLGNIVDESLGDDETWESFVHGPSDEKVITSSDLTWKMEGLRILRQDEDDDGEDDELEMGYFPKEADDASSLLRKRKSEMEDVEHRQKQGRQNTSRTCGVTMQVSRPFITPDSRIDTSKHQDSIASITTKRARPSTEEQTSLLGGIFSAKDALNTFLEMRGAKKSKLIESAHFSTPNAPSPITPNQEPLSKEPQMQESPIHEAHSPLPLPIITPPEIPISIILSSSLLRNRPLIRALQSLLPSLKICERDFSAHNRTVWNPGSVIRSPVPSTLAYEADIIISPTTGLILTTLQHIKQKPLPGHKTAVPLRDRLEKVSARYENLIILAASPPTGLGDSDCLAWADFIGFTLTLQASVLVNYIPVDATNPEDQTMASYISTLIIQHVPPSSFPSTLELLDQESYWEIWLRRAGMNAYAAQAVIVQLKAPEPRAQPGDEGYEAEVQMIDERGPYGLALFVRMGARERMQRLGELVGKRMLERVGWTVDQIWE
ncbi:hypothetical protein DSL72_006181 [Monilinia vaccinii-corymbosi]|uniref:Uncharacterized protein n=1 Tax=Monilinia vaccinii-corymbosi TaxID=61207 RepID=A0A8A3PH08_9HELO|nr:hypothetical protein DSL72_006181 [Monilinia vaccinii-corymbosi]